MAFIKQTPRRFRQEDIDSLRPGQVGVYGLFRNGEWVYVGKGDIRDRLLRHLNGDNPDILRQCPTHWVAEVISGDPARREKDLITQLQPICNKRVG